MLEQVFFKAILRTGNCSEYCRKPKPTLLSGAEISVESQTRQFDRQK